MRALPPHPRRTWVDHIVGTLRDEDGRRVPTPRSDRRRKVTRRWERRPEYLGGMKRATPRWLRRLFTAALIALIASLVAPFTLMVVSAWHWIDIPGWVGQIVMWAIGLSLVGVIVMGVVATAIEDRLASRVLLGMGVCLRCWYDLRGSPKRADGAVVCSECGCAWRIDRTLPAARPGRSA